MVQMKILSRTATVSGAATLLLVAGLTGCGGDDPNQGTSNASAEKSTADICSESWNASSGTVRSMVAGLARQRSAYASIGPDATFNDRCILTVAYPDLDQAMQFREGSAGGSWTMLGQGSASDLPDSVKDWNVQVVSGGKLVPGP